MGVEGVRGAMEAYAKAVMQVVVMVVVMVVVWEGVLVRVRMHQRKQICNGPSISMLCLLGVQNHGS